MELQPALAAMKPLLSGDALSNYAGMVAYSNGRLRAYDGINSIKVEVPDLSGPWCVDGSKLAAILKTGSTLSLNDKHLVIANGRSRFKLYVHDSDLVPDLSHEGDYMPISEADWKVLKLAATFRSPHAVYPWAACIYIRNRKAYVTNNIAAVVFDTTLDVEGMIPAVAVESLASAGAVHIGPYSVALTREALSLRCALPEVAPPENFFKRCDEIPEATVPLAAGLLEAFESTILLDPRNVTIHAGGIRASTAKGDSVEVELETSATVEGIFDPRFIVPALKIASHVNWDDYPKPVLFKGPGVKGMLAGRHA